MQATGLGGALSVPLAAAVTVPGADGVPLTPGRATSALEKRIALLKKKIELLSMLLTILDITSLDMKPSLIQIILQLDI